VTDPTVTSICAVAWPEEMPVNETLDLQRNLKRELGLKLDRVFMNGLYPELFDDENGYWLARLDSLGPVPTDPDVGVLGAGVLRGADPGHDQLFIVGRLRRAAADKYLWRGTESIGASADGSQRDRGPRGAHELPTGYRHVNSGSWG